MTRRKRDKAQFDVRGILESRVGTSPNSGQPMHAYEASMRRAAAEALRGNMAAAKRFFDELIRYKMLKIVKPEDEHQQRLIIPRCWADDAFDAMFAKYGFAPWPGEHDGLISKERWEEVYGSVPRPVRRARRRPQ